MPAAQENPAPDGPRTVRRRSVLALPGVLALGAALAGAPSASAAAPRPVVSPAATRLVVAADGTGDATTIQQAVDLAPSGSTGRVEILVRPGTYHGRVDIGSAKTNLTIVGATGDPEDVVITDDRAAGTPKPGGGTWGTTGSATVTVSGAGFEARHVTFENAFDEAAHPELSGHQAVAVKTRADRVVFDHVRFLGNQDTLYLDTPSADVPARVYVTNSWVEGDVDFVFGRATAVIEDSTIKALRRDSTPSGYVFAPSTSSGFAHGFLVTGTRFLTNAGPGTYYLGRPWHPSSNPDTDPRVVVRDSWLGAHLRGDDVWTTMSGFDWYPGSNAEHANSGPGAVTSPARPRLTDAEAAGHTREAYLAGDDGWAPWRD
ncbi:pectinesterase family protein [Isoptericola sp. 4D.3]|uniref:Pectinesterase n=1 Tax=Isoptericola peretonis TaxID=2918523 RepID=A0ABT0J298_9MICO|nr:pectinesterase family protein [Isoptericola sp. 4D.3]